MFSKKHVLICIALMCCDNCASAQLKMQISAVAFYNFENLFDTLDDPKNWGDNEFLSTGAYNYTGAVYRQKLSNLSTVISDLGAKTMSDGPAIIGVAEIENGHVLEDLVRQPLIKDKYSFIHFDSYDSRGIDVAMLYNPRYFKVLNAQGLRVYINNMKNSKEGRTRDILYVNGILVGDTLHLLVNHWPSRRGGEKASAPLRAAAASAAKKLIDSITSKNTQAKIILMGDLNDDPVSESVTKVLGAKGNIGKVAMNDLYNPWLNFYKKGIGTLGFDDRWNLFDQIMISGSFLKKNNTIEDSWLYYKSEVFKKDYLIEKFGRYKGYPKRSFVNNQWNNGLSDHLPTIIYFIKPVKN